jgi:hypothetical protein
MNLKEVDVKIVLLSFIFVLSSVSSISYATPISLSYVCDVTITGSNQTRYEFNVLGCYFYSNYDNCKIITMTESNRMINSYFYYNGSVLEANKTYRIRANGPGSLFDVHLIANSDTDLFTVVKEVCQTYNMNITIIQVVCLLIVLAVLFAIWKIYRKSKAAGIILLIMMLLVLFFMILYFI